jgi:hypothetical protein
MHTPGLGVLFAAPMLFGSAGCGGGGGVVNGTPPPPPPPASVTACIRPLPSLTFNLGRNTTQWAGTAGIGFLVLNHLDVNAAYVFAPSADDFVLSAAYSFSAAPEAAGVRCNSGRPELSPTRSP